MADETVKLGYSSSSNVTFRGELDTGIPRNEWEEMIETDQVSIVVGLLSELVDIWVKD